MFNSKTAPPHRECSPCGGAVLLWVILHALLLRQKPCLQSDHLLFLTMAITTVTRFRSRDVPETDTAAVP